MAVRFDVLTALPLLTTKHKNATHQTVNIDLTTDHNRCTVIMAMMGLLVCRTICVICQQFLTTEALIVSCQHGDIPDMLPCCSYAMCLNGQTVRSRGGPSDSGIKHQCHRRTTHHNSKYGGKHTTLQSLHSYLIICIQQCRGSPSFQGRPGGASSVL